MNHTHLKTSSSTQIFLKENLSGKNALHHPALVSTDKQTQGIGRLDHSWFHSDEGLAFSCTFPNEKFPMPLSIILGIFLCEYFENHHAKKVFLKWPNDLFITEKKKCGGILIHQTKNIFIAGIGLNWGKDDALNESAGALFEEKKMKPHDKEILPQKIYSYFLSEISELDSLKNRWEKFSFHLNQKVLWHENEKKIEGIFQGLGPNGEALIDGKIFSSGSLTVL